MNLSAMGYAFGNHDASFHQQASELRLSTKSCLMARNNCISCCSSVLTLTTRLFERNTASGLVVLLIIIALILLVTMAY
jgi:hypothetical protein